MRFYYLLLSEWAHHTRYIVDESGSLARKDRFKCESAHWQAGQQRAVGRPKTPTWETALVQVFGVHQRRYGARWRQVALREKGHQVGRQRLRTVMRRRGLSALQPKAFTPRTMDLTHGLGCAPNRLLDQLKPTRANRVWVSDIEDHPKVWGSQIHYICSTSAIIIQSLTDG